MLKWATRRPRKEEPTDSDGLPPSHKRQAAPSRHDALVKVNDECIFVFSWLAVDRKFTLQSIDLVEATGPESKLSARLRKQHRWKLARTGAWHPRGGKSGGEGVLLSRGVTWAEQTSPRCNELAPHWGLMRFMHWTD